MPMGDAGSRLVSSGIPAGATSVRLGGRGQLVAGDQRHLGFEERVIARRDGDRGLDGSAEGRDLDLLLDLPERRAVPIAEHPVESARDRPRRHALDRRDEPLALLARPRPDRQHAVSLRRASGLDADLQQFQRARVGVDRLSGARPVIRSGPWILPSFSPEWKLQPAPGGAGVETSPSPSAGNDPRVFSKVMKCVASRSRTGCGPPWLRARMVSSTGVPSRARSGGAISMASVSRVNS